MQTVGVVCSEKQMGIGIALLVFGLTSLGGHYFSKRAAASPTVALKRRSQNLMAACDLIRLVAFVVTFIYVIS